jgi:uncharacterized protein
MRTTFLLDTSVLLALGLAEHLQNAQVELWFSGNVKKFCTCPITQLGFLRITKQLRKDLSIHEIGQVLQKICRDRRHRFIPADVDVQAVDWRLLLGHQQVTDAYLAGLARQHELKLVTLDKGFAATHPDVAILLK